MEILKEMPGVERRYFHKPKVPPKVKLSCLCDTLPTKDTITPQVFHLLRRYLENQEPGNGFESEIFAYFKGQDAKSLEALRLGLKVYDEIPATKQRCLFREEFLNWPLEKPIDADTLAKAWVDEAVILGRDFLYDQATCEAGKLRPWEREFPGDPDTPQPTKVVAPWPWINSVNGLRTANHRQPLDYYLPQEYQRECTFTLDQDTQEVKAQCQDATWPNCEMSGHQHKGKCLRVPEARAGQVATLVGFNFFSKNCKVELYHSEQPYKYLLEATICGDAKTPVHQPDGAVIADHRVTDRLTFQIPDKTPDGLYEFVPGIYLVRVFVPNDANYNLTDGSKPKHFASNYAYLKILPSQNLKYRIWLDKGHCYNETDGEWFSDEIYLKAIPVVLKAVGETPSWLELPAQETWTWSDADEGETLSNWDWRLVGEPGAPLSFEGFLAIGLIGYEVDSEDALKDQVKSFGDAYLQYLKKIWGLLAGSGAAGAAIGALKAVSLWVAALIAGIVIAAILLVGLIWAAWAPADRVLFDVIVLPEEGLFFLTDPKTPLAATSTRELGSDQDVTLSVIPESKLNYLYVEERRYSSASEGSEYGLWFVYKRDV
ncbi:MAG: hypothetical protein KJZ95_11500 [Caldilinea sp.]|nr:hypothetical protein [Caldilinea sp.]